MTSHTKPHMLLWVDTETTGLDPDRCDLLEIACTITDMRAEQSFDQHHAVIHPDHGIAITHADDLTALRMHLANGLLEASLDSELDYRQAGLDLAEYLNDAARRYTLHPAGTNPRFDLRQIIAHLDPATGLDILQPLSYRHLDLTALRLTALRLTAQAQGDDPYTAGHDTDHRATTCIQRDLAEYRERLAHLGETQR